MARFLEADDVARWALPIFARPGALGAPAAGSPDLHAHTGTPATLRQLAEEHPDIVEVAVAAHPAVSGSQRLAARLCAIAAWPQALRDAALPQMLPVRGGERGLLLHMSDLSLCAALLAEPHVLANFRWAELVGAHSPPAVYGTSGAWPTAPSTVAPAQRPRRSKRGRGEEAGQATAAAAPTCTMANALTALAPSVTAVTIRAVCASDVHAVSTAVAAMSLTRLTLLATGPERGHERGHGYEKRVAEAPTAALRASLRGSATLQHVSVEPCAVRNWYCPSQQRVGLGGLRQCAQLTSLELRGQPSRYAEPLDGAAAGVLSALAHLRTLQICGGVACEATEAPGLARAIAGMRGLQHATLRLTGAALPHVVPTLRQHAALRDVAVETCWKPTQVGVERQLQQLLDLTRLTRLELLACELEQLENAFERTAAASSLQTLRLQHGAGWGHEASRAAHIAPLRALKDLALPGLLLDGAASAEIASALAGLAALTSLDLSKGRTHGDNPAQQLSRVFSSVASLRHLRMEHFFAADNAVGVAFEHLTALTCLEARSSVCLCDASFLLAVAALPRLARLDLQNTKGGGAQHAFSQMPPLPASALSALTWLSIKHSFVPGLGAALVASGARMGALRYCELGGHGLPSEALLALARELPSRTALEFLGLKGARVGDAHIPALGAAFARMPALLHVDLRNNPCFARHRVRGMYDLTRHATVGSDSSVGLDQLHKHVGPAVARGARLSIRCSAGAGGCVYAGE